MPIGGLAFVSRGHLVRAREVSLPSLSLGLFCYDMSLRYGLSLSSGRAEEKAKSERRAFNFRRPAAPVRPSPAGKEATGPRGRYEKKADSSGEFKTWQRERTGLFFSLQLRSCPAPHVQTITRGRPRSACVPFREVLRFPFRPAPVDGRGGRSTEWGNN